MFADLPVELLEKIFSDLDVFTLTSCRFVNKSFNEAIKSSPLLQYKLELSLAGVEANPTCTLDLSECLEAVRSYRRDWERLAWSSSGKWRHSIGNIFHNRGTFVLGEQLTVKHCIDPLPGVRTHRFQPKSKHRQLEECAWFEDRPGGTVGIDSGQDLLFTRTGETPDDILILTLSTYSPYPGVAHPTISMPVGQGSWTDVCICGSIFVATTRPRNGTDLEGNMLVYNWRRGTTLAEIFYPCDYFFLLTEELVGCYVSGKGSPGSPTHFAIFRVPDTKTGCPSPVATPLCVFILPHLTGGKTWYLARERVSDGYGHCPPPKNSTIPFYSPGKQILLSLWLLQSRSIWGNPECTLIIPLRTLLDHIPPDPAPSKIVFHWDAWGPSGSRLLGGGLDPRQMGLDFGWKMAKFGPADPSTMLPPSATGITVYDFNPLPFHGSPDAADEWGRQDSETDAEGRLRRVVTSPSSLPDSVVPGGVRTSLPYRITFVPFELHGQATYPDGYRISLGEDAMIVWTRATFKYLVLNI